MDIAAGIERMGGMRGVYKKSLSILERRLPELMEHLQNFLRQPDLKAFSIEAHGVKDSLVNIGAGALSKMAEVLEIAARRGDLAFGKKGLPLCRRALTVVIQRHFCYNTLDT